MRSSQKSGIAAILLSGVIIFAVAGDIHPSAAQVVILPSGSSAVSEKPVLPEEQPSRNAEKNTSSFRPVSEPDVSSAAGSQTAVKSEAVVMTKEEIVEAAKKPQTEEERQEARKEDPQNNQKPVQDEIAPSTPIHTIPDIPSLPESSEPEPSSAEEPVSSSELPSSAGDSSSFAGSSSDQGVSSEGSDSSQLITSSQDTSASVPDPLPESSAPVPASSADPSSDDPVSVESSVSSESTSSGSVPDGWTISGNKKYYGYQGSYLTGWQSIGGRKYYFDESGALLSETMIDVSEYQKSIDWNQVRADGIDSVMIRIGFRGYGITSPEHPDWGGLKKDSRFEENYQGAKAAGLKVGVYFFTEAINDQEAQDEATFVMAILDGRPLDLPVAFDIEDKGLDPTHRVAGLTQEERNSMCRAFCDTVRAGGYQPMIYSGVNFAVTYINIAELQDYPTWIAHWTSGVTTYRYPFRMWQYSSTETVRGISTSVDMNVLFPTDFQIEPVS